MWFPKCEVHQQWRRSVLFALILDHYPKSDIEVNIPDLDQSSLHKGKVRQLAMMGWLMHVWVSCVLVGKHVDKQMKTVSNICFEEGQH